MPKQAQQRFEGYPCRKCGKSFRTEHGKVIHETVVHKKDAAANSAVVPHPESEPTLQTLQEAVRSISERETEILRQVRTLEALKEDAERLARHRQVLTTAINEIKSSQGVPPDSAAAEVARYRAGGSGQGS